MELWSPGVLLEVVHRLVPVCEEFCTGLQHDELEIQRGQKRFSILTLVVRSRCTTSGLTLLKGVWPARVWPSLRAGWRAV